MAPRRYKKNILNKLVTVKMLTLCSVITIIIIVTFNLILYYPLYSLIEKTQLLNYFISKLQAWNCKLCFINFKMDSTTKKSNNDDLVLPASLPQNVLDSLRDTGARELIVNLKDVPNPRTAAKVVPTIKEWIVSKESDTFSSYHTMMVSGLVESGSDEVDKAFNYTKDLIAKHIAQYLQEALIKEGDHETASRIETELMISSPHVTELISSRRDKESLTIYTSDDNEETVWVEVKIDGNSIQLPPKILPLTPSAVTVQNVPVTQNIGDFKRVEELELRIGYLETEVLTLKRLYTTMEARLAGRTENIPLLLKQSLQSPQEELTPERRAEYEKVKDLALALDARGVKVSAIIKEMDEKFEVAKARIIALAEFHSVPTDGL